MLIDGDNAQASLIEHILAEAEKHGTVTIRRIYGDWTTPNMSSWKDSLQTNAVQPAQQFRNTVGKSATDSALIIEAMDLLHGGTVDGFCIVSSDSDYTRLAMRIREQGLFVMGVGRSNTPMPFVKACEVFVYTENLYPHWIDTVKRAIEMTAANDGWALLSNVGKCIIELDPAFKSRTDGSKNLSLLVGSRQDIFETMVLGSTHKARLKS